MVVLACLTAAIACGSSNQRRTAERQARDGAVKSIGPVRWICDDSAKSVVSVTFFETEPPTLIAKRGDDSSLMHSAISASGAKYEGPDAMYWEHQGEATIAWGRGAPEMHCTKAP